MKTTKYVISWFTRANEDLDTVRLLLEKGGSSNLACFHAQQAAEKYLKGFLAHHEKHIRKVHDLNALLEGCKKVDISLGKLQDPVGFLNQFYTESRYPDDYVEFTREDAQKAYETVLRVKEFVLSKIESKKVKKDKK
ncbi:MAG: HEPN domain-containing protein [Candidatus Portnoybacteria bacterium]|nr:HEPN domain-containing protein [Candidatus Portnoybacteria bacterium]